MMSVHEGEVLEYSTAGIGVARVESEWRRKRKSILSLCDLTAGIDHFLDKQKGLNTGYAQPLFKAGYYSYLTPETASHFVVF